MGTDATAEDYAYLHQLVDQLKPDQVQDARVHVLQLVHSRDESIDLDSDELPGLFGSVFAGRDDYSERVEEILGEGYGQDA
jgi:hypothetical protein